MKKGFVSCSPEELQLSNSSEHREIQSCSTKGHTQLSLKSMGVFALAVVGFFQVLLENKE